MARRRRARHDVSVRTVAVAVYWRRWAVARRRRTRHNVAVGAVAMRGMGGRLVAVARRVGVMFVRAVGGRRRRLRGERGRLGRRGR